MEDLIESILTITDDPKRDYSSDEAVSKKLFELLSEQLQQGGVVRPEVESAKAGELLPESGAQNGRVGVNGGQIGDLDIYQNLIEP